MGTTAQKLNRVLETKSDLKTVINYTGANITEETTFKEYPKLLNKAYVDILNDEGESLYNALPKTTGTGTSIDLNTEKGKMKIELNSSDLTQSGTPTPDNPQNIHVVRGKQNIEILGKNLIEPKLPTTTKNGITITNNGDGSWTLNGTATSNVDFRIDQSTPIGHDNLKTYNGTYTLSCNELINGIELVITQINTWTTIARMRNNNIPVTFTTNKDNCFIYVFVSSGTTLNNLTIHPQLEKNSAVTSYKPYLKQNYPIDLLGKNLFDKDNANILNGWMDNNTQMYLQTSQNNRILYISCQPNTTYTISRSILTTVFRVATYDSTPIPTTTSTGTNYVINGLIKNNNATSITITTGINAKYLLVHYGNVVNDTNINESLASIQIEKGSQATEYVPYFEPIELCKIENYQDSIYYNTNWYYSNLFTKIESYNGETITTPYKSTTGGLDIGATIYYYNSSNTPIQITDTTLIQQLDNLTNAKSYDDVTHITQTNDDLPFNLEVSALAKIK